MSSFAVVNERSLEEYVATYLKKRLLKMHKSDLGESLFINDMFYWDTFKRDEDRQGQGKVIKKLYVSHFFQLKRVRKMIERHESYLIRWINFIDDHFHKYSSCHKLSSCSDVLT